LDEAGIPTVSVTQVPSITRISKPSLACFVAHPFGLTLGQVGDQRLHESILREVLEAATGTHPAGSIVPLDHRWPDDLRTRQLRKKAH
jgi:hypothetical protein